MARVPQMTEKKSFWRPSCFLNLGGSFVLLLLTKVMKKEKLLLLYWVLNQVQDDKPEYVDWIPASAGMTKTVAFTEPNKHKLEGALDFFALVEF